MKKPKLNKKLKTAIKIIVSAVFLAWIVWSTNWQDVLFYVKEINPWYLIAYVGVLFLSFWLSSHKWKILSQYKGFNFSGFTFFKLYFTGTFINNFMPSFIAGDAYKAYEIGKKDEKYSQAASTVMMDRITGLIGATFLALFFSLLNWKKVIADETLFVINIILVLSCGSDILIPQIRKIKFLKKIVFKIAPEKFIEFLRELGNYNKDKKIVVQSITYSVLFSIVGVALLNYLLFLALDIKIGLLDYLSVVFLISIVSSIPISVNNIGLKEWAYITFFGVFGLNPAGVLTVAIISRTVQMLISFFALPLYLKNKKIKKI